MRFGYCANTNFLRTGDPKSKAIFEGVLVAGYDYLETQLSDLLALSPAQYDEFKKRLADAGVPCRANLQLFPMFMPLVGEDHDLDDILEHAKRALPVAADLGSELVVFGHGLTRSVPEDESPELARQQLLDILRAVDPLAASYNLKIAIEPLCQRETNLINSFPEAVAFAMECGQSTGAVFDLYHGAAEGQSPMDITRSPEKLFHLHIACPPRRTVPSDADDGSPYAAFAEAVKKCGYDDKLSVEANVPEGADAAATIAGALRVLRRYFA